MSSKPAEVPPYPKRELEVEETPGLTALPTFKRQKLEHQQENFPPSFWDNLSQLYLTTRSLREFDRRTVWPSLPKQPHLTGAAQIDSSKLVEFAKQGGPDLQDIRAYPPFKQRSLGQGSSSNLAMTFDGSTTAYSLNFQQHLVDHGCYLPMHEGPLGSVHPQNFDHILDRLESPIPSLPALTEKDFSDFKSINKSCHSEQDVIANVVNLLERRHMPREMSVVFNNLNKLTIPSISNPGPDWYDGVEPEKLDVVVRNYLDKLIVPASDKSVACLPNFFLELKGPKGSVSTLVRQGWYAGTLGARGVHELRDWWEPHQLEDMKAYTIVATYEPVQLTLIFYTVHPIRSDNTAHRPLSSLPMRHYSYHMIKLKSYVLDNDLDSFNKGLWALQNAREWAKEQRDRLVDGCNVKAPTLR
ncbi:MAG: hypothetical protein Q9180_005231 [Flavoplaca navasiana]